MRESAHLIPTAVAGLFFGFFLAIGLTVWWWARRQGLANRDIRSALDDLIPRRRLC